MERDRRRRATAPPYPIRDRRPARDTRPSPMPDSSAVSERFSRPDVAAIAASLTVVHETAFARVHVGRPTRLVVLEWFAYANAAEYRQMLEDALAIARELECERWVAHNQQLKVIAPASQRFTTEDWWPRFATLPLTRLGILVTKDDFGRISLERIIARATPASPFDIRYVSTFDDALSWVHDDRRDAAASVGLTTETPGSTIA
jgi:hypothetical protein